MKVERVRVADVLKLIRRPVPIDPLKEYTLIRIYSFGKGIFHSEPKSGAELGNYRFFRVEPGDLVLSNIGAWEGGIALATKVDAGIIGNHRVLTYIPIEQRIDTAWAKWFFLSEPGMALVRQAAPGTTMRNRTLAIERFEALELPLPPLEEQQRVSARLNQLQDSATDLRRLHERVSSLSDAFIASCSTRSDLDSQTKAQLGRRRVALGEILRPTTSHVDIEPNQRYRIAGIFSFGKGPLHRKEILGAETSYKTFTVLRQGDVVISKLGGWEGAVTVVGPEFDGYCVSSEYPTFKIVDESCLPGYMLGVTRSPLFWESVNANTRGSMARRKRISSDEFLRVEIWLPPIDVQERIASWIHTLDLGSRFWQRSEELRSAIVPAAMNQAFAELN